MARGRQIYLQAEEIEELAILVDNARMGNGDEMGLAESFGEPLHEYVQREKFLANLKSKLYYYVPIQDVKSRE